MNFVKTVFTFIYDEFCVVDGLLITHLKTDRSNFVHRKIMFLFRVFGTHSAFTNGLLRSRFALIRALKKTRSIYTQVLKNYLLLKISCFNRVNKLSRMFHCSI